MWQLIKKSRNILIIEDDVDIVGLLDKLFSGESSRVETATNGAEAMTKIKDSDFDVIILDWMLGDEDGVLLEQEIRKISQAPILMLTVKSDKEDIARALDNGADDYMTKPFSLTELEARVERLIARNPEMSFFGTSIKINQVEINIKNHLIKIDDNFVPLTRREFQVLAYLARQRNVVVTKAELEKNVLGLLPVISPHIINHHISNLRKKLGDAINIITVPSIGFVLKTEAVITK